MEHNFTKIELNSLRKQASHEIERRIFSGELKPGDRLPAERELALAMGISRAILNFAIKDLETKGFVKIVPRHGAYINDYRQRSTPQMLMSLIEHSRAEVGFELFADLLETRRLLERECTRLAVMRITSKELEELRSNLDSMELSKNAEDFAKANYNFHHTLICASGNIVYGMIIRSFEDSIRWYLTAYFTSEENRKVSYKQHEQLFNALERRDSEWADSTMLDIFSEGITGLKNKFK